MTFRAGDKVVERIVYDLASFAVRQTPVIEGAPIVVPLVRAIRQLTKKYEGEDRVSELWEAAHYAIRPEPMIEYELARVGDARQRRANEVILAYVNFLEAKPRERYETKRAAAAKVYEQIDALVADGKLELDAGNLLRRAHLVPIRGPADVKRRAALLVQARRAVSSHIREQARWKTWVDDSIAQFQKIHGLGLVNEQP